MSVLKVRNGASSWESIPAGGVGVPSGGSAGQTLVKSSSTDYATEWADPLVVASGSATSGDYVTCYYRKWSDGKVEAWLHYEATVACTTSGYGGYRTSELSYSIPSEVGLINSTYLIIGQKSNANSVRLASLYPNSETMAKMFLWSHESTTVTVKVDAYLLGNWK